ncbi:aminotransferase-like domain-containing protein [Actinokineospora iranica]|uniref:DNA-binding transcriptional regulator, MocR family, contains an aminotransferase domain n=1 Tax=Actinokineospora iranica TaxID=1271860 RepID=A0A1G6UXN6_9PSEU|nr:PLP-dependent aminotransferase family protein [Actinokineospora iranica]SDD46014.1 DNA-binding transcriptional regulator, MocR family, contains an aminotransferase domain [Actinokineospora iranica]
MTASELISFARGAPSLDIVDVSGLKAAADAALTNDPGGALGYGTAIGYPPLRKYLAERHGVAEEQVLVTNGSMQADAFLFDELVKPGQPVIVERPTYDRTLLGLRQRDADVRPVSLAVDGIDVEELAGLLEGGLRPTFAHVIPNFQNPAGYTLSLAKRTRLLELAEQYDFVIFEDDPYVQIRFAGEPLPTMLELDEGRGRVVYASSFSKTVAPGVRVGYIVGPAELVAKVRVRATNTYISPNMFAQAVVHRFCVDGGLERSIATVNAALAERVQTLCDALSKHLPDAKFTAPEGGYFMWVELPEGVDVAKLLPAAEERGVTFVKGTDFLLDGGERTMRLAYSGVRADQIEEGVSRLADALASLA